MDFLKQVANWNNHRPLLWMAIKHLTYNGSHRIKALELGMGDGSTPYLADYFNSMGGKLVSYDHNPEWVMKFIKHESEFCTFLVADWEKTLIEYKKWDLAFIDQWPAERRHIDAINLKDQADIVVIHDTEPQSTGYMMDKVWPHYKYVKHLSVPEHEAWASIMSNKIDVTKFEIPEFEIV